MNILVCGYCNSVVEPGKYGHCPYCAGELLSAKSRHIADEDEAVMDNRSDPLTPYYLGDYWLDSGVTRERGIDYGDTDGGVNMIFLGTGITQPQEPQEPHSLRRWLDRLRG